MQIRKEKEMLKRVASLKHRVIEFHCAPSLRIASPSGISSESGQSAPETFLLPAYLNVVRCLPEEVMRRIARSVEPQASEVH